MARDYFDESKSKPKKRKKVVKKSQPSAASIKKSIQQSQARGAKRTQQTNVQAQQSYQNTRTTSVSGRGAASTAHRQAQHTPSQGYRSRQNQKSYGTTQPTRRALSPTSSNANRTRNTPATAAEMRRQNLSSTLEKNKDPLGINKSKTPATAKEMMENRQGTSTSNIKQKVQEAQKRHNGKADKGTDNLAKSAALAAFHGGKGAVHSLYGAISRASIYDDPDFAPDTMEALLRGEDIDKAKKKAAKKKELKLAGIREKTKIEQQKVEDIKAQEAAKDKGPIPLRKMTVGAAMFTGQRLVDTALAGPYSLVSMGARVLEDERNAGQEKNEKIKKRLAESGQFTQEELDKEFKKLDKRAGANAYASAGIEMLSERLFTGAGLSKKYMPKGTSGFLDKAADKILGKIGSTAVGKVGLGVAEETLEEWIANPLQAAVSNRMTGNRLQELQGEEIRREYQKQAMSLKEIQATSADINSQAFLEQAKAVYKEAGANDKEASRIAELARDYFNADLSGDSKTAEEKLNQITDILAGGESDIREKWTLRDALEVAGEMVLSVGAEATPGAITSSMAGNNYKANYGIDGVKKLAQVVENLDENKSDRAKAIIDDINKGKDVSGTQVRNLMQWSNEAALKAQDREIARDDLVQKRMKSEKLYVPIVDSEYNLAPATAERFEAISERVVDNIQDDMKLNMSDVDAYAIGDVVAAFETGTISAEQMNELNLENPEARTVFEKETGISLKQYIVKDKSGNIKVAESNVKMQKALFSMAADNYMDSARIEQANWNDTARGQAAEELAANMDGMGSIGVQRVLESVDPRNRGDFMLAGSIARRVYEHARLTNDSWDEVKKDFKNAFPNTSMDESMRYVYDMAKRSKDIAETKYYGQQVKDKHLLKDSDPMYVPGEFTNKSKRVPKHSELATLTNMATTLGVNIVMEDLGNDNGSYSPSTRTIHLNSNKTMGENLQFVLSHEVTHHLAAYAPDEYLKLSRFIMDKAYKADADKFTESIKSIQKLYKERKDQDLSPEEALEEIIANNAHEFWQDENFIDDVTREEPSLAQAIINSIKDILRKIRSVLSSGNVTDENDRQFLFDEINAYDTAYKMWVNAFRVAKADQANQTINEWQDAVNAESGSTERFSLSDSNITSYSTGAYSGQVNMRSEYKDGDDVLGYVDWNVYEGTPSISYIEVNEDSRRQGIARLLLQSIQKEYPNEEIRFGMTTDDGTALVDAITEEVVNEDVRAKRQELESKKAELDRIGDRINELTDKDALSEEEDAELSEIGPQWDALNSEIHDLEYELQGEKETQRFVKYSLSEQQDADYMKAVESGDMETAQRMVDEAAKVAGYDYDGWHGTDADFTEFSPSYISSDNKSGIGFYFAMDGLAFEYKNKIKAKIKLNSPIIANYKNSSKDISERTWKKFAEEIGVKYEDIKGNSDVDTYVKASDINKISKDEFLRKIRDITGKDGIISYERNSYISFSPENIKDASPVTYDDDGNVIPLSERFNQENPDVRFSISAQQDADYMKAVESGDMGTAQRMVDEAAKMAGYNSPVLYHGTLSDVKFTTFKPNAFLTEINGDNQIKGYFSEDRSYSEAYGDVRSFYVRINNPLEFNETNDKTLDEWREWFASKGITDVVFDSGIEKDTLKGADYGDGRRVFGTWEIFDSGSYWHGDGNLTERIRAAGYDGMKWDYGEKAWIPFDDTAIKSADPVTYDDNGNVIPLSQRFNAESDDVRFSLSSPVERVKDLVAVHNVWPEKLIRSLDMGGLAMPSIAVIRAAMGHGKYGSITLLFNSDVIDPELSEDNRIWGGDAYTPTAPMISRKFNEEKGEVIEKRLLGILGFNDRYEFADSVKGLRLPALDEDNLGDKLRYGTEPRDAYANDLTLQLAYLMEQGKAPAIPMMSVNMRNQDETFWLNLSKKISEKDVDEYNAGTLSVQERIDRFGPIIGETIKESKANSEFYKKRPELLSKYDNLQFADVDNYMHDLKRYYDEGGLPQRVDEGKLRDALEERLDHAEYSEWLDNLFDGIVESEGIRNNEDLFDEDGNRRDWEELHDPVTVENVVASMKESLAAGQGSFGGVIRGAAQKEYKTLDELRADEDRLQMLDDEEYEKIEKEAEAKIDAVLEEINDHNPIQSSYEYRGAYDIGGYVAEILNTTRDKYEIQAMLSDEYDIEATDEMMDELMDGIDAIAEIPTGYFEAKPAKAIPFTDVAAALVSDVQSSVNDEIKRRLEEQGVKVIEYDHSSEEDRKAKLNEIADAEQLKFSLTPENRDAETQAEIERIQAKPRTNKQDRIFLRDNGAKLTHKDFNSLYSAHKLNLRGASNLEEQIEDIKANGFKGGQYIFNLLPASLNDWSLTDRKPNVIEQSYGVREGETVLLVPEHYNNDDTVVNGFKPLDYEIVTAERDYQPYYELYEKAYDEAQETEKRYSITEDAEGKSLTEGQREYFKNSQARDEQGRLVPVYHTTNNGGFTVFDPSKSDDHRSLFFASNFDVSQTYGTYAGSRFRFQDYDFKSLNDFADAYRENFRTRLNDPDNDLLDQVITHLRIHVENKNYMPANDLGSTMFARVKKYMKLAEAGDEKANKYRIEMEGPYGGMIRASSYEELLGKLSRQMSNNASNSGYYECYLNLENPLIIDAQGQNWNSIPYGEYSEDAVLAIKNITVQDIRGQIYVNVAGDRKVDNEWQAFRESKTIDYELDHDEIPNAVWNQVYDFFIEQGLTDRVADEYADGTVFDYNGLDTYDENGNKVESEARRYRTRQLAEIAQNEGYDGVIIRNCYDIGGVSPLRGDALSDIYIAFSSNQVKDVNNLNPTENPDIRFSITPEDEVKSKMAYDYAMDDSYEALEYYEQRLADLTDEAAENRPVKKFSEDKIAEFYSGLRSAESWVHTDPIEEEDAVRMAKSKDDFFANLNAKWNDRWTTEGEVLDVKSVKTDVRNLVMGVMQNSDTDSQYKNDLVKKTLFDIRTAFQLMKQDRPEVASALLYHSAQRMIDNVQFYVDGTFDQYKELKHYLRTTRISIGEEYWGDVDYDAFRKRNFGRIKLVKGRTNVDQIYQELEEMFPEWFNEEETMSVPDQLLQIEHVLDSVQPYKEAYSSEAAAELAFDIADDLYEIMVNGDEVRSLADTYKARYDAKTKAMKQRHAEAMLRVRKAKEEGIQKERQKFREYKEKQKEKKLHTKHFDRINENYKWLKERLLTNTKDKHIPEQYKKELAGLLAAFDLQTVGSKKLEAYRGYKAQKTIQMSAIRSGLQAMHEAYPTFFVHDAITDKIDALAKEVDGKTIDALSVDQLAEIDDILKGLKSDFITYDRIVVKGKQRAAADAGKAQAKSAIEHAEQFGPGKDLQNAPGVIDKIINLDEMTAPYFFRRIDPNKEGLGMMYGEIRRSFDRYVRNQNELNGWMEDIVGKYHQKGILWNKYGSGELTNWRSDNYAVTFNFDGGAVRLTPAQMMSIYCLSKRPQAQQHMYSEQGGIVVAPVSFNAKILSDVKKKANKALPVRITESDVQQIIAQLTPEQVQVAEQLQELMSTKMAEWGNEASMDVMGIELFKEREYFPIKSDKAALTQELNDDDFVQAIRNFGFTKALTPQANNAIMVEDIFDVVTEHCNNMNLYNAYSKAFDDFMKVYNFRDYGEEGTGYTVQQAVAHAYSQKATTFIMTFLRDLNGNVSGRASGIEDAYNSLLGNAKKAAVFANLRVAAQQPTAITRAFFVIDPKYIKGIKIEKGAMEEMFEHCPIALWKSWGYYDINMGKSIEDIMMNNGRWLEDKATELYGALDNVTWTAIWQMVKNEMKDTHPNVEIGTDEYWDLCNERMSEIVDLTQVVDSPLHRSHAMRSKNFLVKTATAFMAEPTLTFNMLRDGYVRSAEAKRMGKMLLAGQIASKTIVVALLQAATVAGAAGLVDALRKKKPDKDDEDESFLHLWWVNALENFKDELRFWNKIYFVKDIGSIMEGWDNANLALQGVQKFSLGWRQLNGDPYARSSASWYENLADGLGYMFGVPVKTMRTGIENAMDMLGVTSPIIDATKERLDSIADNAKDKDAKGSIVGMVTSDDFKIEGNGIFGKLLAKADESDKKSDKKSKGKSKTNAKMTHDEERDALRDLEAKARANVEGLSGSEVDDVLWDTLSEGYTKHLDNGDLDYIEHLALIYRNCGGDENIFREKIKAKIGSAYKKTFKDNPTDEDLYAQDRMRHFMEERLGMTEEEVSAIVYKTDAARDLKVAFKINNEEYINNELNLLARAGITYEDVEKLYKNRNRMKLETYNGKYKDMLKSTGNYLFPADGIITSDFGNRDSPGGIGSTNHQGIDIAGAKGTPIQAADGGTVIMAGWYGGYGKTVQIQHDDGTVTQYSHLDWWDVNEGDTVAQGQEVGLMGNTGNSTGTHLHFGVMKNGSYVDPKDYINTNDKEWNLNA